MSNMSAHYCRTWLNSLAHFGASTDSTTNNRKMWRRYGFRSRESHTLRSLPVSVQGIFSLKFPLILH